MDTSTFKFQENTTCSIAVIRAIRLSLEKIDYSEKAILADFPIEQGSDGTNIITISNYWGKYRDKYLHIKEDNQTSEDMEDKAKKGNFAMVIHNTSISNKFHCVLFNEIIGDKVSYWDPCLGNKIVCKRQFDEMRKHDNPLYKFREVHYMSKKA